jgi:hypothetical protein
MVHARRPWEPPRLYSWTVLPPDDGEPGAVGITDDEQLALEHASEALRTAPDGSRGLVHRAQPSIARIGYYYVGLIARGSVDPESGVVVWEDLPVLNSLDSLTDEMPPEALAAGLEDVKTESERRQLLGIPIEAPKVSGR